MMRPRLCLNRILDVAVLCGIAGEVFREWSNRSRNRFQNFSTKINGFRQSLQVGVSGSFEKPEVDIGHVTRIARLEKDCPTMALRVNFHHGEAIRAWWVLGDNIDGLCRPVATI